MSCILRVSASDIDTVLKSTELRPYRVTGRTVHFTVSEADLGDFGGQVRDAIEYLSANTSELEKLVASDGLEATLDFGVAWRDVVAQNDLLPAELVRRAGVFGFSIELSHYSVAEEENVAEAQRGASAGRVDTHRCRGTEDLA